MTTFCLFTVEPVFNIHHLPYLNIIFFEKMYYREMQSIMRHLYTSKNHTHNLTSNSNALNKKHPFCKTKPHRASVVVSYAYMYTKARIASIKIIEWDLSCPPHPSQAQYVLNSNCMCTSHHAGVQNQPPFVYK